MADSSVRRAQVLSLDEIAGYHKDAVSSLKSYFDESAANSNERFFGYTPNERAEELKTRIDETSLRSILVILASLEASFHLDYESRCRKRRKDDLSRALRAIYRDIEERVSLDQDIFVAWKTHLVASKGLIGELRSAFKLRHWLAHGRYWPPKFGRNFDFDSIFDLAVAVNEEFFQDKAEPL